MSDTPPDHTPPDHASRTRRIGPLRTRLERELVRSHRARLTEGGRTRAALQRDLEQLQAGVREAQERIARHDRETVTGHEAVIETLLESLGAALEPGEAVVRDVVDEAGTWLEIAPAADLAAGPGS